MFSSTITHISCNSDRKLDGGRNYQFSWKEVRRSCLRLLVSGTLPQGSELLLQRKRSDKQCAQSYSSIITLSLLTAWKYHRESSMTYYHRPISLRRRIISSCCTDGSICAAFRWRIQESRNHVRCSFGSRTFH